MFREAIKEALEVKERDQKWLSRHTGVHASQISLYLRGEKALGSEKIEDIFKFLGIGVKAPKQ